MSNDEQTLYSENPSMFRNHPIWFVVSILLIAAFGVGLLILIPWFIESKSKLLTITNKRAILRKGILSKSTTEVWHDNVRNVQLSQSFLQRILGVGKLGISSAGQSGMEIEINGIPDPEQAKSIIDANR